MSKRAADGLVVFDLMSSSSSSSETRSGPRWCRCTAGAARWRGAAPLAMARAWRCTTRRPRRASCRPPRRPGRRTARRSARCTRRRTACSSCRAPPTAACTCAAPPVAPNPSSIPTLPYPAHAPSPQARLRCEVSVARAALPGKRAQLACGRAARGCPAARRCGEPPSRSASGRACASCEPRSAPRPKGWPGTGDSWLAVKSLNRASAQHRPPYLRMLCTSCGRRPCAAARQVGAARQTEPARCHLGGRRRRCGGRAGERDLAGHGRRRRARVPLGHAARGAARRGRARAWRQARARSRCRVSSARWRAHAAHVNARQRLWDSMGWSPCSATSSYIVLTAGPADVSSQPKAAWGQGFDRARSPCAAARPPRRCGFPSQPVPGRAARWRPWRSARWATA